MEQASGSGLFLWVFQVGLPAPGLFLFTSPGPWAKVPVIPGEATAIPGPFPASVPDLVEVACGARLGPVLADPSTCPPDARLLLAGGHLCGMALRVSQWRAGLWDPEPAARMQRVAQQFLPRRPLPAQPPQGLCHTVLPSTLPDNLGTLLGQLVPAALKQALDLQQLRILEDVGRGLLAAPHLCWGLPRGRLADHRGWGAHAGYSEDENRR